MKVILTGATGMVGEGVLLECLQNTMVEQVLSVSRKSCGINHPKLQELLVPDFMNLESHKEALTGYDACFYCAGISSVGMDEAKYTQITYNTTLHFATVLAELNPKMVFNYVSGASTDSSEKGKVMWARVKGRTENDLMKLPFRGVYNFRPAIMKPFRGQKNVKALFRFLLPLFLVLFKSKSLTLSQVGKAMIKKVDNWSEERVLEVGDIKCLAMS